MCCYAGTISALTATTFKHLNAEPLDSLAVSIAAAPIGNLGTGSFLRDLFLKITSHAVLKLALSGSDNLAEVALRAGAEHLVGYTLSKAVSEYYSQLSSGPIADSILKRLNDEDLFFTPVLSGDNANSGSYRQQVAPLASVNFRFIYSPYTHFVTAVVRSSCEGKIWRYLLPLEVQEKSFRGIKRAEPVGTFEVYLLP